VGDVPADPFTTLNSPDPARPATGVSQQLGEPVDVGVEPAMTDDPLVGLHHLDRHRPLVGIHPDHHWLLVHLCPSPIAWV
jgi:hypothetical protein